MTSSLGTRASILLSTPMAYLVTYWIHPFMWIQPDRTLPQVLLLSYLLYLLLGKLRLQIVGGRLIMLFSIFLFLNWVVFSVVSFLWQTLFLAPLCCFIKPWHGTMGPAPLSNALNSCSPSIILLAHLAMFRSSFRDSRSEFQNCSQCILFSA